MSRPTPCPDPDPPARREFAKLDGEYDGARIAAEAAERWREYVADLQDPEPEPEAGR